MPLLGFWKKLVNPKDDPSAERPESPAEGGFTNGQSSDAKPGSSQKREEKSNDRHFAAKPESANRPQNANKPATNPSAAVNKARTKAKIGDKTLATGTDSSVGSGFFQKARNIVIKQSTMIDKFQTIHNVIQGKTALQILSQKATPGADVKADASVSPPTYHPTALIQLVAKIQTWLLDDQRRSDFLWLWGPARIGKSTVTQAVTKFAAEKGVLGAAYFFSRLDRRDNYSEVFVTLAYQLAIQFPGYQPLVTKALVADADLLEKNPGVQFKRLIIEPLSSLSSERKRVIILDGLDECRGERAQLEIIEFINNAILTQNSLPIVWIISSRPESHLVSAFYRADYGTQCWREDISFDTTAGNRAALDKLANHALVDTGVKSPGRYPLPRCHPGTRKSTIEEITNCIADTQRAYDMLWLYGPAGAGKTAIAQTIAEDADASAVLGAAVFLSRTREQNNPSRFWTSVSLDLVHHNVWYELLVRQHIHDHDESVLTAGLRAQFDKLIVPSLSMIQSLSATVAKRRLPIVIDGLDECQGQKEQSGIIECICDAIRRPVALPAIWMICSRPEPHLKHVFRKAQSEDLCWVKELLIDDPEAQGDVERYLQDELWRIAKKHGGGLCKEGNWPPKDAFDKIVSASSGLFVFVTTIARFVGEPGSDPQEQLTAVIASIDGSPTLSSTANPLAFVDKLYLDILGRSPSDLLSTTLQLRGICAVCPPLPMLHFAQLFEFNLHQLQMALMSLHSVVDVPYGEDMVEQPLRYYHASFSDFLANHDRSGTFSQDLNTHSFRVADACLRVLGVTKTSYANNLAWEPTGFEQVNPSNLSVSNGILIFAATHAWDLCMRIRGSELELIRDAVAHFDYRSLRSVSDAIPVQSFVRFLRWLYCSMKDVHDLQSLVRTSPSSALDAQFIEKCAGISEPLTLEPTFEEGELQESPRYTLIGFNEKTVIILVVPDGVMAYTAEDVDDL